jgi:hypothetical protein
MSERLSVEPLQEALGRVQIPALLLGIVGCALTALGYFVDRHAFFAAYLVAFLFWLGVALGCLAVAMIHNLSGGGWGMAIRRILEAGFSLLPLNAIFFVPLLFGLETLYPWVGEHAHDEILRRKAEYLNVPAFQMRAAIYFAVWIITALAIQQLSSGTDIAEEPLRRRRLALLSGPGLVLWCLTMTFAAVDWSMSLEPHWYSSIYGVIYWAGQAVNGMAGAVLVLILLRNVPPISTQYSVARQHDLGNFLLAFVMFWAYVSFSQLIIIWSANLPEETPWYLHRSRGGWQYVAMGLCVLHFFAPFLLLLSRQAKRSARWLAGIAVLLLAMRWVDLHFLVSPAIWPDQFFLHWTHITAMLGLGGIWIATFCWRLPARASLPVYDLAEEEETLHDVAHQRAV